MSAVLAVQDLRKAFGGVQAVAGVSFTVAAGELLALIGPNGAGKTTCFNLVNGQLEADAGEVRLLQRRISGLPPRQIWRLGVGRTFQITATFASMSVRENVQMALLSHHRRLRAVFARAHDLYAAEALALLEKVGMADQAERRCSVLAYGDLKRVELAVALANAPKLLLMDEPTAGMAPEERKELMELTARLAKADGMAVLFVLDRGRIIAEGTPADVRANPQVQSVYLGGQAS
jgi:branched-chain amino acid transport system ATP-binding protein